MAHPVIQLHSFIYQNTINLSLYILYIMNSRVLPDVYVIEIIDIHSLA